VRVRRHRPAITTSAARKGFCGVIVEVKATEHSGGLGGAEIERRLLEMGFVEGAPIHLVHEGVFGRDRSRSGLPTARWRCGGAKRGR